MLPVSQIAKSAYVALQAYETKAEKSIIDDSLNKDVFEAKKAHQIADAIWRVSTPVVSSTGIFEDDVALFMARFSQNGDHQKQRKTRQMLQFAEQESILAARFAQDQNNLRLKNQLIAVRNAIEQTKKDLQSAEYQSRQEVQTLSSMHSSIHNAILTSFSGRY